MNAQRSGWVFTRKMDFAVFWVPMLVGGLLFVLFGSNFKSTPVYVFALVLAVLDLSHLFASEFPALRLSFLGLANHWRTYFLPALLCGAWLIGYHYAPIPTLSILAYAAMFHPIRQQFGWVMISRQKFSDPTPRWLDTVMIWNQLIAPFIYWNSELSEAPKLYFTPNDFHLLFSAEVALTALAIYWLINIFYFSEMFRKKYPVNAGKLSILGATAVMFYVPMVLVRDNFLWFVLFVPGHAVSYLIFSWRATTAEGRSPSPQGKWLARFSHPIAFLTIITVAAALVVPHLKGLRTPQFTSMNPLVALPVILHYYFDSYIWLNRFRQK